MEYSKTVRQWDDSRLDDKNFSVHISWKVNLDFNSHNVNESTNIEYSVNKSWKRRKCKTISLNMNISYLKEKEKRVEYCTSFNSKRESRLIKEWIPCDILLIK